MNFIHATLLLAAIVLAQLFFGGGDYTRLIYMLPSCIVLGGSGLLAGAALRRAPSRMDRICVLSVVMLSGFVLVRVALSPSTWLAQADLFSVVTGLLVYFLTALCVSGGHARIVVAFGLIVLGVAQAGVGLYQFARAPGFHPLVEGGLQGASTRATGFFVNANHLAGFLEVAVLLGASMCLWGLRRAVARMLWGYATLVCLAGLILTGSRGGYVSASVGFLVLCALSVWTVRTRLSRELMPRIVAGAVLLIVIAAAGAWLMRRSPVIESRASTVLSGLEVRPQLWDAAWKQFQLAPAFGTGSRTYTYYGRMFRELRFQRETDSPHSDWLQMLAEYGITGLLLAVGFVFAHLRHGGRRWLRMARRHGAGVSGAGERGALALQIGAISALSALLVHAAVDFNFHIPSNLMVAAVLFGILASSRARPDEAISVWRVRALHAVPVVLGLCMLVLAVPRLRSEQLAERVRKAARAGDLETVLSDGAKAVAGGSRNPEVHFMYGEAKRLVSLFIADPAEARATLGAAHEAFSTALALFPQESRYLLGDAWVLGKLGRNAEAETQLAKAKQIDPKSPAPWICSALHWHRLGKPGQALADYREAEKLGAGLIPQIFGELHEYLDPAELEKLATQSRPPP